MKEQLENLGYTDIKMIETSDGTGYIGTKNGGSIIIPPNYEKTEGLSMLVCGQGGTGNILYGSNFAINDEVTRERLTGPNLLTNAKNGEFPDTTVVLAPNDLYPGFSRAQYKPDPTKDLGANLLNDAYTLLNNNGANITNVGVQGFSNGGPGSMLSLGGFLELNPSTNINTKVVLCDTYNVEEIVKLYDKTNPNYLDEGKINAMNALINNDTEIYSLNWTSPKVYNGHAKSVSELSQLMAQKGFNYQFTKSSRLQHADYMVDFFNGGGLNFLVGNGDLNLDDRYYSQFYRYDSDGNEVASDIKLGLYKIMSVASATKYNYLKTVSDLVPTSGKLTSDTLYVYQQMNVLRNKIKQSKFLNTTSKQVFKNTTGIPGCISAYIDAYYNIMGSLMDSLMKETEVITSVASTIGDMDTSLNNQAQELFDEKSAPQEIETIFPNVVKKITTPKVTNDYPSTEKTNLQNNSNKKGIINIYKERKDGSKLQISSEDEKIIGVEYVYEFASEVEANRKAIEFREEFKDINYIKEIVVKNKTVEVIFKQGSFANMDSKTVIARYLNGGN